jgi:methylated-DNA-[protein]-cysteine S-methyltransferase
MQVFTQYYQSPVGRLEISANQQAIVSIHFADAQKKPGPGKPPTPESCAPIEQCIQELTEYFSGDRRIFTVPFKLEGTEFQQRAWQALTTIPYGQTITYGQQAVRLNNPKAARAVGLCNGNNPIVLIVPCHRVIGSNGSLTGFGGDLWVKRWLLDHEQKYASPSRQISLF